MLLVSSFRSFLSFAVVVSILLSLPSSSSAVRLSPRSTLSHRSHPSLLAPPSPAHILHSRQARPPRPETVQAARVALRKRAAVKQLRGLSERAEEVEESVRRGAERVRRSVGGAREKREVATFGQAIHDNLFHLLRLISASQASSFSTSSPCNVEHVSLVELADDHLPLLSRTVQTFESSLDAATSALPHLPRQQQDAVAAVMEELEGELQGLVEGVVRRVGMGEEMMTRFRRDDFAAVPFRA
ncbi:hypothetical protein JCM8547_004354 [Rhodosporidiobolus lusitaniae]